MSKQPQRYYSATSGGFLLEGINPIPADGVPVTDADFDTLLAAQAAGKEIRTGADGRPVAAERICTDDAQLAQIRARRDRLLATCDFTQLPDSPLTDAQRAAWAAYRTALRNLPETCATDPASVQWPEQPA